MRPPVSGHYKVYIAHAGTIVGIGGGDVLHVDPWDHELEEGYVYTVRLGDGGEALRRVRCYAGEVWLTCDARPDLDHRAAGVEVTGRVLRVVRWEDVGPLETEEARARP